MLQEDEMRGKNTLIEIAADSSVNNFIAYKFVKSENVSIFAAQNSKRVSI